MIVRSIAVADWRCFIAPLTLGPLEDGLNVVWAPNGSGKSTLFEAMRRGLLDLHRVTGKDVETLRPWGRSLSPKVTVEFVQSGVEYRVSKQFLDNPSSLLERRENGRYARLAEGAKADEAVRVMLTRNPPGKGLAQTKNWGLAQVLWAPQGNLALTDLSDDLVADIRTMLSSQVTGGEAGAVEKRIEQRYLGFFSPTGKLKAGKDAPPLVRLKEEMGRVLEERARAKALHEEFLAASQRVEELKTRRARAEARAEETRKKLDHARAREREYTALKNEERRCSERVGTAEARYKALDERIRHIKATEQDLESAAADVRQLAGQLPLLEQELKERREEAEKAKRELEAARAGAAEVKKAEEAAESARRYEALKRELAELGVLRARVKQAEDDFGKWKAERESVVAPDPRTLQRIRAALKERDDTRLRIEASLITLEIVSEKDGTVEVLAGEEEGKRPLTTGVPVQVKGAPQVAVNLPGTARLRAWGPVGSVDEHRRKLAGAEQKLKELTGPYRTMEIDALETLAERAKLCDLALEKTATELKTLLSGRTVQEFSRRNETLAAEVQTLLVGRPQWEQSPPDAGQLQSEAKEAGSRFSARVRDAEAAWDGAQKALSGASAQRDTQAKNLDGERKRAEQLKGRLDALKQDGKGIEELTAEMTRSAMECRAAEGGLQEAVGRLAAYGDDPPKLVLALEKQFKDAETELTLTRDMASREEGGLESLAARGTYSALAAAEEMEASLKKEIENEQLRVEAVRLLWHTVAECRKEAVAAVARPVEAAASDILRRIAGKAPGRVVIGDHFGPAGIVPGLLADPIPPAGLSGGEQEQLYLATRLALAEVLRGDERQAVVLDDVLTATDAVRQARILNILEKVADRLQVVILTCHPERYRALRDARFFDLEELRKV